MPVRPRHGAAMSSAACFKRILPLAAFRGLVAVGPRALVVQSFVVPRAISGFDACSGATGTAAVVSRARPKAAARLVPRRRGRNHRALEGLDTERGTVAALRASMDDDDEYDVVSI